jgi:hypothetical protein
MRATFRSKRIDGLFCSEEVIAGPAFRQCVKEPVRGGYPYPTHHIDAATKERVRKYRRRTGMVWPLACQITRADGGRIAWA